MNTIEKVSNKAIDELLDELKKQLSNNGLFSNRPFIRDGIIDPLKFSQQKTKVLFISNESNIDGYYATNRTEYDLRKEFLEYIDKKHDDWKGKLRERVSSLYQVVINDYSKKPYEVADCFAFINLNKTGGGNNIDNRILAFCDCYGEFIKSEIDIINPDIIIWLGCNTLDNEEIRKKCGVDYKGNRYSIGDIPVVRMWHTSCQCKGDLLGKFDNKIIDKLACKLYKELKTLND